MMIDKALIAGAFTEDLAEAGDITSNAIVPADAILHAVFRARENIIVAGIPLLQAVIYYADTTLKVEIIHSDGAHCLAGANIAKVSGNARAILRAERIALNFMQFLSGIATLTRRYVDAVAGLPVHILDTRKTIPGYRALSKYATALGGAMNHRMGLYDAILIKDNHLALVGGVEAAVTKARAAGQHEIILECDTIAQVELALALNVPRLLLDNMDIATLRHVVNLNQKRCILEASGGVSLETVRAIAQTGVDYISIGRLTHSAVAVDIGLDYLTFS
jgi:nicotinate-nucleotide pyrophosphorylase (carboxylating)